MAPSGMVLNWSRNEIDLDRCCFNFGKFIVKVLKRDEIYEALDLVMLALFNTKNDPIINALMFDPESVESLRSWIKMHLEQNVAYGCFLKSVVEQGKIKKLDKYKLIAVDVLYVRNLRDDFKLSEDSGLAFGNFKTYIKRIEKHVWSMGKQKICNILTSFGIFISDEFRNDTKIAIETMKNRKKLAEALRMTLGAAFIGVEMQNAAEKYHDILHDFNKDDCKELGLGDVSEKEHIHLKTVFPIIVMGYRKNFKRAGRTVAEVRKKGHPFNKKIKLEK